MELEGNYYRAFLYNRHVKGFKERKYICLFNISLDTTFFNISSDSNLIQRYFAEYLLDIENEHVFFRKKNIYLINSYNNIISDLNKNVSYISSIIKEINIFLPDTIVNLLKHSDELNQVLGVELLKIELWKMNL